MTIGESFGKLKTKGKGDDQSETEIRGRPLLVYVFEVLTNKNSVDKFDVTYGIDMI